MTKKKRSTKTTKKYQVLVRHPGVGTYYGKDETNFKRAIKTPRAVKVIQVTVTEDVVWEAK